MMCLERVREIHYLQFDEFVSAQGVNLPGKRVITWLWYLQPTLFYIIHNRTYTTALFHVFPLLSHLKDHHEPLQFPMIQTRSTQSSCSMLGNKLVLTARFFICVGRRRTNKERLDWRPETVLVLERPLAHSSFPSVTLSRCCENIVLSNV